MIYGRSLEAQATASLAAATGYDSHIFDLFPASASAQIDTDTAVILLCHDLNWELPALQAAREAKPFYLGALAAIEPTRYVCKSSIELGWSEEETAQPGPCRDIPQSPGCAYSGTLRAGRNRLCRLHHEEDSCLAPVVLILAAGRESAFRLRGKYP